MTINPKNAFVFYFSGANARFEPKTRKSWLDKTEQTVFIGVFMLRYLTAGESHGKCLTAILDGVPANLVLSEDDINEELRRRQVGYGRGNRMSIERDTAEITSGVRFGKTIGAPVAMIIKNRDWQNWKEIMNVWARGNGQGARGEEVTRPRPGHADLAGVLKYRQYDIRNILERSI